MKFPETLKNSLPNMVTHKRKWLFGFSIFQKRPGLAEKIRKTHQDRLEAIAMASNPEVLKAFSATVEAERSYSADKFTKGPKFPNFQKTS